MTFNGTPKEKFRQTYIWNLLGDLGSQTYPDCVSVCSPSSPIGSENQRSMHVSDSTKKLSRFTFITEKEGSTVIEQFDGADVEEATLRWFHESETQPGEPLEDNPPTAVEDVNNVWCTSGYDPQGTFFGAYCSHRT